MHPFIYLEMSAIDCHFNLLFALSAGNIWSHYPGFNWAGPDSSHGLWVWTSVGRFYFCYTNQNCGNSLCFCFQEECKGSRLHRNVLRCVNCGVSFRLRLCLAENGMILSINVFLLHSSNLIFLCSNTVVSAGLFRIMGSEIAELPLVATSRDSQGLVSPWSYCMYYISSFKWTIKNGYFEFSLNKPAPWIMYLCNA